MLRGAVDAQVEVIGERVDTYNPDTGQVFWLDADRRIGGNPVAAAPIPVPSKRETGTGAADPGSTP